MVVVNTGTGVTYQYLAANPVYEGFPQLRLAVDVYTGTPRP